MDKSVEQNFQILNVSYSPADGKYMITMPKGSSVAEAAFCMSFIIKCFLRDGYIKDSEEVLSLVDKYLNDPQYEEIK